jgi:hypothetical protein
MAINFPSSSTLNQISQVGSNYYIWNGKHNKCLSKYNLKYLINNKKIL